MDSLVPSTKRREEPPSWTKRQAAEVEPELPPLATAKATWPAPLRTVRTRALACG